MGMQSLSLYGVSRELGFIGFIGETMLLDDGVL